MAHTLEGLTSLDGAGSRLAFTILILEGSMLRHQPEFPLAVDQTPVDSTPVTGRIYCLQGLMLIVVCFLLITYHYIFYRETIN